MLSSNNIHNAFNYIFTKEIVDQNCDGGNDYDEK
jgi:hypothetical protein